MEEAKHVIWYAHVACRSIVIFLYKICLVAHNKPIIRMHNRSQTDIGAPILHIAYGSFHVDFKNVVRPNIYYPLIKSTNHLEYHMTSIIPSQNPITPLIPTIFEWQKRYILGIIQEFDL